MQQENDKKSPKKAKIRSSSPLKFQGGEWISPQAPRGWGESVSGKRGELVSLSRQNWIKWIPRSRFPRPDAQCEKALIFACE